MTFASAASMCLPRNRSNALPLKTTVGPMNKSSWQREGDEPDYRFTLANERTFLAWIRTALALLAAGVLLAQFASRMQPRLMVSAVALLMCLLATVVCVQAYRRWRANEIAMRCKDRLPASALLLTLSVSLFLVSGLLMGLVLWTLR